MNINQVNRKSNLSLAIGCTNDCNKFEHLSNFAFLAGKSCPSSPFSLGQRQQSSRWRPGKDGRMGSGTSRMGSRPSRTRRAKRSALSSCLFVCGSSANQMEDDPSNFLVNSMKKGKSKKLRIPTKESASASGARTGLISVRTETEIGASSENRVDKPENSSFEDCLTDIEASNQGKCLCKSDESVPPHLPVDYRTNEKACTSYANQLISDSVSANMRSYVDVVNGIDNMMDKDESRICVGVRDSSVSSSEEFGDSFSDEVSIENHESEGMFVESSDSCSSYVLSDSAVTSQSPRDDTIQETTPPGLGTFVSNREQGQGSSSLFQVDMAGTSSSTSSSSPEINNHEARRNGRRVFWDAFSRRRFGMHIDPHTFGPLADDTDSTRSHGRWLLDFNGDFFSNRVGHDSGHMGSRSHSMNEQFWHSGSEAWGRFHSSLERVNRQTNTCPAGLHPSGTCSCESIVTAEESGTRASISRIVLLAEALFEVLDEIHRQPVPLSLSVVSLPAQEAVVDSFPVKHYRVPDTSDSGDDAAQCYICLSEYEEGDKIRVLPCHHEFHMSCVDKWLKEIHGVCPLCRGDVSEGFTNDSVSNSGAPSFD
ncbi:uncharacterized protein LOC127806790 [Diospyros lotus]|uniref:uncharacterized protein LOC127806790 n=1 Tax=Diospyros lotus TaxID=55363 RepID=UPI00224F789D|nr:uncharacterized protein LOC127806790 [Diospyros lotus]